MISIIYLFKVKKDKTEKFIETWKEMTELIYEYESSLGSRLHKKDEQTFIAYAQWPDKYTFENSGEKLPQKAIELKRIMRSTCEKVERLFELEIIEDLLKTSK